jgi:hypothetical protein
MTYLTQNEIANNPSMLNRVAQCVASEGIQSGMDADSWTISYRREWAAAPGWSDAWEYSHNTHPDDPDYDPGADETVITDGQILSQIQAMNAPTIPERPDTPDNELPPEPEASPDPLPTEPEPEAAPKTDSDT